MEDGRDPSTAGQPAGTSLLDRIKGLAKSWLDIAGTSISGEALNFSPDLVDEDEVRLRAQMRACLDAKGGEVSARARASALGREYLALSPLGRKRFLTVMGTDFGPDAARVDVAAEALVNAEKQDRAQAERRLREALEPPRIKLLTQFNALPEGVKFLVDLRTELAGMTGDDEHLRALETDLRALLASWFDVGFLELRRLTWQSPAHVLEKLIAYEAVHAIQGWDDLKNRLDSDRRLYAFFHPRMPDEPLIFVEVALVKGIAGNIHDLLDLTAPLGDPSQADTAIFYSINNAQRGLNGISFGNFLIKKVVDELSHEFPRLKTFATLSPVPGFRSWLERRLGEGEPGLLTPAEHKALTQLSHGTGAKGSLKAILAEDGWHQDPRLAETLRGPLTRLAARYLAVEKKTNGRPLDPVAQFHLSNGARIERLNWLADVSRKGIGQSAGLMVNYLYKPDEIEANHESFAANGKVAVSSEIRALTKG